MHFFSQQTLTCSASLSPSHFFAASFLLLSSLFFSLIHPVWFVSIRLSPFWHHRALITIYACASALSTRTPALFGLALPLNRAVSSPPLSLAQSSQPYFLHTAIPSFRPGYCYSHPLADPRPRSHVGQGPTDTHRNTRWTPAVHSACIHRDESSSGFKDESPAAFGVESPRDCGDKFKQNTHSAYQYNSDPKTNERDFATESICNLDSLYQSDSEKQNDANAVSVSSTAEAPGCTTPYKNIDVMMMYSNSIGARDSMYSEKRSLSHTDQVSIKARTSKDLPPLPTYYLYHPKNCPLHRGAPPRLSPIGALSPPHRSGAPPPGAASSSLSSPLFPRSHTLPALAAPLYYPNLYPPIPPRAPPLPPKLHQAPLQSRVASKISLSLHTSYTFSPCLTSRMSVYLSVCLYFCLSSLVWMWWPTRLCHLWPRGFADLKELGNCSCFIYQKVRPCRPSDTSYLLCPFKSAKGLQKGNSCFCHKVSRVTLITVSLSLCLSFLTCLSLCPDVVLVVFLFLHGVPTQTRAFHAKRTLSSCLMMM